MISWWDWELRFWWFFTLKMMIIWAFFAIFALLIFSLESLTLLLEGSAGFWLNILFAFKWVNPWGPAHFLCLWFRQLDDMDPYPRKPYLLEFYPPRTFYAFGIEECARILSSWHTWIEPVFVTHSLHQWDWFWSHDYWWNCLVVAAATTGGFHAIAK